MVRTGGLKTDKLARLLLALVDLGLLATIFIAPLFMGGRCEIGRLVYVSTVSTTAVCWAARQCLVRDPRWRWCGVELLLLGGTLLVLLQLTPLPDNWLARISPEVGRLLPLWLPHDSGQLPLGMWQTASLTPQATRGGLVTFLAHGMLFLLVVQRIGNRADVERLVRWIAVAAVAMAALGLVQLACGNGRFLWLYEHPSRTTCGAVKGTFQNQNHFAHFLAVGIGPIIWWLHRFTSGAKSPRRRALHRNGPWIRGQRDWAELPPLLLTIGLVVVILAGLLTFSRGGIIVMCVASVVCLWNLYRKGLVGRRAAIAIAGGGIFLAGAIAIHGYEPLSQRLGTLRNADSLSELSRGRHALWSAHLQAIPKFGLIGAGVGSHPEIYRTFMREHVDLEFTHGESGYLHLLLETGFLGLALAATFAAMAGCWCVQALTRSKTTTDAILATALLAGLLASLIHSLVDFVWYIPACMSLTIVIAACACRLFQMARSARDTHGAAASSLSSGRVFRLLGQTGELRLVAAAWPALTIGSIFAASVMIANRMPPARAALAWDSYLKISLAERRTPKDDQGEQLERDAEKRRCLAKVLAADPYHARANLRMATLQLRQFDALQQASEIPMPLAQIRDAALASQFSTPAAQDEWLSRVMGDNRRYLDCALWHARRALRLCPLQGEGYAHLAELAFLEQRPRLMKLAYVDQALRVRPYNGVVLLAAGAEAALAGDERRAWDLYKRAFHQDPQQRRRVIALVAPQVAGEEFLKRFTPGGEGLDELYTSYRRQNRGDDARAVGRELVVSLHRAAGHETGSTAARHWERAGEVHEFLGHSQQAAECARNAVFHTPMNYHRRQRLARLLMASGEFDAAIGEFEWCLHRKPNDASIRRALELASRQRLVAHGADGRY